MDTITKNQPDALKAAANVYTFIMENDKVRVLDVKFRPGDKAAMHYHPDHVVYVLNDGTIKITAADGKSMNVELKKGQAIWMQAGRHSAENIGKTESHNVVVELK